MEGGREKLAEVGGEGIDLGRVVARGHRDAQAGRSTWNSRRTDRLDMPAALEQGGAQTDGSLVVTDDDAEDR